MTGRKLSLSVGIAGIPSHFCVCNLLPGHVECSLATGNQRDQPLFFRTIPLQPLVGRRATGALMARARIVFVRK